MCKRLTLRPLKPPPKVPKEKEISEMKEKKEIIAEEKKDGKKCCTLKTLLLFLLENLLFQRVNICGDKSEDSWPSESIGNPAVLNNPAEKMEKPRPNVYDGSWGQMSFRSVAKCSFTPEYRYLLSVYLLTLKLKKATPQKKNICNYLLHAILYGKRYSA